LPFETVNRSSLYAEYADRRRVSFARVSDLKWHVLLGFFE